MAGSDYLFHRYDFKSFINLYPKIVLIDTARSWSLALNEQSPSHVKLNP
ncbi:hypothetical protein PRUB_a5170 [Pseudoalteromonas rubra]|uniref:Uncharacterized protein n=1 Tax=Pseudoalteromonas rubra TaxID=43658 RepID=A0A8T0CAH1_9GAMM|nr:hypothetical protein PRUB_a5170 [Pseudoalteromonas rubra]